MLFDSSFNDRRKELRKKIQYCFFSIEAEFNKKQKLSLDSTNNMLTVIDARMLNTLIALYWEGFCKELCYTLQEKYKNVLRQSEDSVKIAVNMLSHTFIKTVKKETKTFSRLHDKLFENFIRNSQSIAPVFTPNEFFLKDVPEFKDSFFNAILPSLVLTQLTQRLEAERELELSDFFLTLQSQLNSIYRTRNNFVHDVFSSNETFSLTWSELKTLKESFENINRFIDKIEECLIENSYLCSSESEIG
jgi:hypothetical protein